MSFEENSLDLNLNQRQAQHMCRPNERVESAATVNRAITGVTIHTSHEYGEPKKAMESRYHQPRGVYTREAVAISNQHVPFSMSGQKRLMGDPQL